MPAPSTIGGTRGMASLASLHIFVAAALKISMSDGNIGTTVIEVMLVIHFPSVSEFVRSVLAVAVAAAWSLARPASPPAFAA